MRIVRIAAATALTVALATSAWAQGLPRAQSPEEVGFSTERLKRLTARMKEGVDKRASTRNSTWAASIENTVAWLPK